MRVLDDIFEHQIVLPSYKGPNPLLETAERRGRPMAIIASLSRLDPNTIDLFGMRSG